MNNFIKTVKSKSKDFLINFSKATANYKQNSTLCAEKLLKYTCF